jgi:hypothetical protein
MWPKPCFGQTKIKHKKNLTNIFKWCTHTSTLLPPPPSPTKTRGVSHFGLAIYIKKYLKAKEESWKLKYFTMQKI